MKKLCLITLIFISVKAFAVTASLTSISGSVTVIVPGQKEIKITSNVDVPEGTIIKTGLKGSVVIKMMNSESVIKPLSVIRISEMGTTEDANNIDLQLKRGTVHSRVDKIKGKKTSFQVKTPVSTLSVRGTEVEISHGPNFGTDLKTFTGIADIEDKTGNKREVKKDQTTNVQNNKPPTTENQENSKTFTVKIAPPELTESEHQSISSSNDILPETPTENPAQVVQDIVDVAKTTKINATIQFQE